MLLCSIDHTIPKSNTLSSDTRTYLRGRQHSQHYDLRDNTAVSWVWGVCGDGTLLLRATRRVAELRNPLDSNQLPHYYVTLITIDPTPSLRVYRGS